MLPTNRADVGAALSAETNIDENIDKIGVRQEGQVEEVIKVRLMHLLNQQFKQLLADFTIPTNEL